MSSPTPLTDPQHGLAYTTALRLIPLFLTKGVDTNAAHQTALDALHAYSPESEADFINAARTIAFSMAALSLLGQAASEDMTMAAQMRAYGRANAMNRSADQSERTMMQRRRYQKAALPVDQPAAVPPIPQPKLTEQKVQAAVDEAMQEFYASLPKADPTPAPSAQSAESRPAVVISPVQPAAAIHHAVTTKPATASFRSSLLAQAAMPPSIGPHGTAIPAVRHQPQTAS